MTTINSNLLTELLNEENDLIISMYMPMERAGRDVRGNPIQLKNRLSAAQEQLEKAGFTADEMDELLGDIEKLINDREFWQHQLDGLVIFVAPEKTRIWRVPISFEPLTTVGKKAHVKPLLDYLTHDGRFFVLALSQNEVRFFRGTQQSIEQLDIDEMPTSLAEALKYDDPEGHLQLHTTPSSSGQSGDALYHGHGDVETDDKTQILRFFQQVDAALSPLLMQENAPLLLAGVDYLIPIYHEANGYQHVVDGHIGGNPEQWSAEVLHEKAWEMIAPIFAERRQEAWQQYQNGHGDAGMVVKGVEEVAQAAFQGRTKVAFIAKSKHKWGTFDRQTGQVDLYDEGSDEAIDILDFVATQTLRNGGEVYFVDQEDSEVEIEEPAVALLRF